MAKLNKNINWFKKNIAPNIEDYKVEYSFFKNGDFGNLDRVEFEGNNKGGNIDFWEKNWIEIHFYDYLNDIELIHVLLEPNQIEEKEKALKEIEQILTKVSL